MANRLTLSSETKTQIEEILAPLKNPEKWAALALPFSPSAHAVVRMEGAPGTGKTALSNFMARRLPKPPIHISFGDIAGCQIGETEHKIMAIFKTAHETETTTIIMEECDSLFWSRDKVTEDTMHMLSFVNTLLIELDRFITRKETPSLVILTTNYPQLLDAALERRITDVIKLFPPVGRHAEKIWLSKLPECMVQPTLEPSKLDQLAELGATPDQMEKAILRICRRAMMENRNPTFADFQLS